MEVISVYFPYFLLFPLLIIPSYYLVYFYPMVYIITDYWYHSHYFSHNFYPILAYENRNIIFYPIKVYVLSPFLLLFPYYISVYVSLVGVPSIKTHRSRRSGCAAVEAPHWPRRPRRQGSDPGTIAWCSGRSWQSPLDFPENVGKMDGKWMENGWNRWNWSIVSCGK